MNDLKNDMDHKAACGIASQGDDVVRRAILMHTGQDEIVMEDVARLGVLAKFSDGTEVFSYGGVDLIRLWPIEVNTKIENGSTVVTACQKYQMLLDRDAVT